MAWIWLATGVGHGFEYQSDSDKKSLEMARKNVTVKKPHEPVIK
jgi:hypothetical protein